MFVVVIWLTFAALVGVAASSRGRLGLGWFCLAVLLSPLVAIIVLLVLPDLELRDQLNELRAGVGGNDRKPRRDVEQTK
jgi:hypothetical protein